MERHLCEDCMTDYYEIERNEGTLFPSFTILGGIAGGIVGLLTGSILLVPATMLTGLAVDTIRCDRCGSTENIHEFLLETDQLDAKRYTRFPFRFQRPEEQYTYDELTEQFVPLQEESQSDSYESVQIDDFSHESVTFDMPDASLEVESFGFDMDGFGEGDGSGGGME